MNVHKIYILTQAVHSGKTTLLQQWLRNKDEHVAGILTPDREGKRKIFDISKKQYHDFEMDDGHPKNDLVEIGRYKFSKSSFNIARDILRNSITENPDWMIIDEVGKLEVEKQDGLEPVLTDVIDFYKNGTAKGKLILVVRNYLRDEVINKYGLNNDMVLHKSFFE